MGRLDPLTKRQRSLQMGLVKSKNTNPELAVRRVLRSLGLRYRVHARAVAGKPDIVFSKAKMAIFVHGCFWHRHKRCSRTRMPKSRIRFWREKFASNVARDLAVRKKLLREGWKVLVVWECVSENPRKLEAVLRLFLGDLI